MHERFDGELSVRAIVIFSVGLVVVTAGAFVLMWALNRSFEERAAREPVDVPPLPDMAVEHQIQGPLLQSHPEAEWTAMKAEEAADLASYRLLDPGTGRVQIPIDVAMERLLHDGLPSWPAEAP